MNNFFKSLPFRLLLGIAVGVICGLVFPENVMKVIVTLQYVMGQLITFCVPLIIIGFIAPSITKLGSNASRLLAVAVVIAYTSSVGAALASMGAGYAIIPHLSIDTSVEGLRDLPTVVFQLDIPQIMSVMSALALSILLGLAVTWTKSQRFAELLGEVVTDSTKKNLELRADAEHGATQGRADLAKQAKALNLDAIHDIVHEIARDEARHGKAFEGLLKRYFG